jgi:hypothetical protein
MKLQYAIGGGLLYVLACATPALASPTMIRLGYSDCATCHVSPQGGGLLTSYGRGIDVAQSLRARELPPSDADRRRFLYDVRLVAVGQEATALASHTGTASSTFNVFVRSSTRLSEHQRFTSTFGLAGPALGTATQAGGGATTVIVPKAIWEYRPKDGLQLSAGREELPTGIGLPDPQAYVRKNTNPGTTAYPTQVKGFFWNHRFQFTPYAFAPGGDEDVRLRQWGAGALAGVSLWRRGVIGVSGVDSRSPAFNRQSMGAYARLGFGRWGVLAEHEVTGRSSTDPTAATTQFVAGHTQLFFAPYEWLVTSLGAEEMTMQGAARGRTYRLAPGAQVRVSENLTVAFTMRDVFAGTTTGRSRTFSVLVAVKTVE